MPKTRNKRTPDFAGGSDDDFLVWGDQLAQSGDPRGELIHIQHALAAKPKDRKLRAAQAALFAKHPELAPPKPAQLSLLFRPKMTWRLGFIDIARVENVTPDTFSALIDHPSARFMRRLDVTVCSRMITAIVLLLARTPRPTLRELVITETSVDLGGAPKHLRYDTERAHAHTRGDALWRAVSGVERLEVRAFRLFHSLELPELRELVAIGYPFCTKPWVAPKLETLTWRVGRKELLETCVRKNDVDVLDVALASDLPALRRIDLRNCETENPYTETEREPFENSLRRARRGRLDVVF